LFLKGSGELPPVRRVKPLLPVYRVLLTGIHLMRTGDLEQSTPGDTAFAKGYCLSFRWKL